MALPSLVTPNNLSLVELVSVECPSLNVSVLTDAVAHSRDKLVDFSPLLG